jgi:hypothetical protein
LKGPQISFHSAIDAVKASWRRIALTALALTLAVSLYYIPFPGLIRFDNLTVGEDAFSIGALGVLSWFTAVVAMELAAIALPKLRSKKWIASGHADPLSGATIILSFMIAALYAYQYTISFQSFDYVSTDLFSGTLSCFASLLGGFAVYIFLARFIHRSGIGHGFWVLAAGIALSALPGQIADMMDVFRQGGVSLSNVFVHLAQPCAVLALLAGVMLVREKNTGDAISPVVWPALMSTTLSGLLMTLIGIAAKSSSVEVEWHEFASRNFWFVQAAPVAVLAASLSWFYLEQREETVIKVLTVTAVFLSAITATVPLTNDLLTLPLSFLDLAVLSWLALVWRNLAVERAMRYRLNLRQQP